MVFEKVPKGTRGAGTPPSNALTRFVLRQLVKWHRRKGDRFQGLDILYLTTVGARTQERRQIPLAYFPADPVAFEAAGDVAGDHGGWLVVASYAGSARNPGWYHNIAAHPDQIWIAVGGRRLRVVADQLDGASRTEAWERIAAAQPRYANYQKKTDRAIPVIRLRSADEAAGEAAGERTS